MIPLTLTALEAAYLHDTLGHPLDSLEPITQSAKDGMSRDLLERIGSAYLELVPTNGNFAATTDSATIYVNASEATLLLAMVKSTAFGADKKTLVGIPIIRQLYVGLHDDMLPEFPDAGDAATYDLTDAGRDHLMKLYQPYSEGGDV